MSKGCYIVGVGTPWMNCGFDWSQHVFLSENSARDFFNKKVNELSESTIKECHLSVEEADTYRKRVEETASDIYAYDPKDRWSVKFERGNFEE